MVRVDDFSKIMPSTLFFRGSMISPRWRDCLSSMPRLIMDIQLCRRQIQQGEKMSVFHGMIFPLLIFRQELYYQLRQFPNKLICFFCVHHQRRQQAYYRIRSYIDQQPLAQGAAHQLAA